MSDRAINRSDKEYILTIKLADFRHKDLACRGAKFMKRAAAAFLQFTQPLRAAQDLYYQFLFHFG